jgi:Cu/Ag efflux protein CusF
MPIMHATAGLVRACFASAALLAGLAAATADAAPVPHLSARPAPTLVVPVQAQRAAPAKLFQGTGTVTATEPAGTLTINHAPIEGLMPAMEMTFRLNPATLGKGVHPGDDVEFSVDGKTYIITALKVRKHAH